jgi:hypothetical protein
VKNGDCPDGVTAGCACRSTWGIVVSDGLACIGGIADVGIEPRAMVTGSGATGVELPERKWSTPSSVT